jgi:hypothetical protein
MFTLIALALVATALASSSSSSSSSSSGIKQVGTKVNADNVVKYGSSFYYYEKSFNGDLQRAVSTCKSLTLSSSTSSSEECEFFFRRAAQFANQTIR